MIEIGQPSPSIDLLPVLSRYAGLHAVVVGDLMLDEYFAGTVERISPEAPVPVVRVKNMERRLGGAANVARQVAALGVSVSLAGVLGADAAGDDVLQLCADAAIDTRAVLRSADRNTTRKLRVLGHSQQLLRMDWEDTRPCAPSTIADLLTRLQDIRRPDVIILSDYAKGVVTPQALEGMMAMGARFDTLVLVDPKHCDFRRYRGATTITPNLRELEAAVGAHIDADDTAAVAAEARALMARANLKAMAITLGDRGMLVVPADGPEISIPAIQRAVYDVTGAGDTAIAVLAVSLAAKASFVAAAQIANAAAGLAVGQVGTVAVDADSIRAALTGVSMGKVMSRHELAMHAASWRRAGKRIAFTNGCFDLLHSGHLTLLREARKLGDVLVLAINSDASIRRLKGAERPLVGQAERAALLAALDCIDAVTIFEEDTPLEIIQRVRPQVLVKGADYRIDEVVGREFVEADGGRVALVPLVPDKSTTALVQRIRDVR
ncbi:MAG: D-glycero-beta-D-manno-heptose 1-phosphate adenylyltransferase [Steroidobacteraceae bacterium]